MRTFNDLKIGDYYYRMVVTDAGEVVVDKTKITEITTRKYIYQTEPMVVFKYEQRYKTENGHGCKMDEMNIQKNDMDKSYAIDGRGYNDIMFLADMECQNDAKLILLDNVLDNVTEAIEETEEDLEEFKTKKEAIAKQIESLKNNSDEDETVDNDSQFERDLKNVEYWFKHIGPFVFPEDNETLESIIKYMKNNK